MTDLDAAIRSRIGDMGDEQCVDLLFATVGWNHCTVNESVNLLKVALIAALTGEEEKNDTG